MSVRPVPDNASSPSLEAAGTDRLSEAHGAIRACPETSGPPSFMDSTSRQTARLRIVTPEPNTRPDTHPVIGPSVVLDCDGGYTCECTACREERAALQRRGVRTLRPTYVKNRAA